ncbi:MAG: hypothetical protein ACT4N2_05850 [Hyphomicrobium sp.]
MIEWTATMGTPLRRLAVALATAAGGCAVGEAPIDSGHAGLSCVDDSPRCIAERQRTLSALVADPQRRWVKEQPTPSAYASGVRLFAFKTTKKTLTCDELAAGRREADGAPSSLKGAGSSLTPAQVSRGAMFASEVGRELGNEMKRRCKKG